MKIIPTLNFQFIKEVEKRKLDDYEKQLKEKVDKVVIDDILKERKRIEDELNMLIEELGNSKISESNDRNILNNIKNNENKISQISVYKNTPFILNRKSVNYIPNIMKLELKNCMFIIVTMINRIVEINNLKEVADSEDDVLKLIKKTSIKAEDCKEKRLKEINEITKVLCYFLLQIGSN